MRASVFASAVSMYLVLRRWVHWWPATFSGGLLYGFSAFETFYADRSLFISFLALPPILFLIVYEVMFRQRWKASTTGISLGFVLSLQFFISTEVLAGSLFMALLGCALYAVSNRKAIAAKWTYIKKSLTFGLLVSAVLLIYPLGFALFGPGRIDGVPNSPNALAQLHGDLLGPFIPGYLQHLGTSHLATFWINSVAMYMGIPFFVAIGVTVFVLRRRGIVVMAGSLTACSLILSLGSTLYVDGHDTHMPLPFIVLAHLPGTDGLLSTRLSLFTVLFGSAVVAMGAEALYGYVVERTATGLHHPPFGKLIAFFLVALVVLVVGLPMLPNHTEQVSASGAPSRAVSNALGAIPSGSVVLAYPYPDKPIDVPFSYKYQSIDDALLDQAMTGMNFKVIGGYDWRPITPKGYQSYATIYASKLKPVSVQALFSSAFNGQATPQQEEILAHSSVNADMRTFMRKYHVGAVMVLTLGQNPYRIVTDVEAAIGRPSLLRGLVVWYHVQQRLKGRA